MRVIARYNEGIRNTEGFVVQKGEHLENKGREASSYLWYIINFWDKLEGTYEFRQAKETEHRVGEFIHKCDQTGVPHHPRLPIKQIADMIDLEIPEELHFTAGAQFDVTTEQIKQRSLDWYKNAFEVSMKEKEAPWVFERLWKYIFNL